MADFTRTIEIIFGAVDDTGGGLASLQTNLNTINQSAENLSVPLAKVAEFALKAEAAVLALGVTFLTLAVNEASKFGEKIEEIGSLVNNTASQNELLSDSVLEFAQNVNGIGSASGLDEINAALYNAISNVGSAAKAFDVLAIAEKGSQVGAVDLNTAALLLTGTMNAYGLVTDDSATNTANAERVMAAMFTTVQNGKTTMAELEQALGRVSSTAAAANIPIETVGAAIAALTGAGIGTNEAVTLLNALLKELLSPSDNLTKALGGLSLTADGLPKVLDALKVATGGSAEKFFTLFTNSEAAKGAMVLANDSAGKFDGTLLAMNDSVKTFNANYKTMVGGVADSSIKLANEIQALQIKIGEPLQAGWAGILDGLTKIGSGLEISIDAGAFDPVFESFSGFETEIGAVLKKIGANLPAALGQVDFAGLIASFKDLGFSIGGIFENLDLTTPRGIADAIQFVVDSFESLARVASGVVGVWAPVIRSFVDGVGVFNNLQDSTKKTAGELSGLAQVFQTLKSSFDAGGNALVDVSKLFQGTFNIILESASFATIAITGLATGTLGIQLAVKAASLAVAEFVPGFKPYINAIELAVTAYAAYRIAIAAAALATTGFGIASAALTSPIGAVVLALGTIVFAVRENISAWQEYKDRQVGIAENETNTAKTLSLNKAKLEEIGKALGIVIPNMAAFNLAMDNGLIVMDKTTGAYSLTALGAKEFGVSLKNTEISGTEFAKSVTLVGLGLEGVTWAVDKVVGSFWTLAEAENAALKEIEKGNVTSITFSDGLYSLRSAAGEAKDGFNEFGQSAEEAAEAQKKANRAIAEAKDPFKDLSDSQKLAIQNAHDMEKTLVGLASNERIKAMEFQVNLNIAQLEAQVKQVEAAFTQIGNFYKENANIIGKLTEGFMAGATDKDREFFKQQIAIQMEMEQQVVDSQIQLNESISQMNRAYAQSLTQETLIRIDSNGLDESIERFMFEVLKKIQTTVVGNRSAFLLGAGQLA